MKQSNFILGMRALGIIPALELEFASCKAGQAEGFAKQGPIEMLTFLLDSRFEQCLKVSRSVRVFEIETGFKIVGRLHDGTHT